MCVPGNAYPSPSATVCHSDDFYITRTKEEHYKNKITEALDIQTTHVRRDLLLLLVTSKGKLVRKVDDNKTKTNFHAHNVMTWLLAATISVLFALATRGFTKKAKDWSHRGRNKRKHCLILMSGHHLTGRESMVVQYVLPLSVMYLTQTHTLHNVGKRNHVHKVNCLSRLYPGYKGRDKEQSRLSILKTIAALCEAENRSSVFWCKARKFI